MKNRFNIFTLWLLLAAVAFGQTSNVQKGTGTNNLTGTLNTGTQTITANDGGTITYSGTGTINAKTLQTYTHNEHHSVGGPLRGFGAWQRLGYAWRYSSIRYYRRC
jgi:hypothetical protein